MRNRFSQPNNLSDITLILLFSLFAWGPLLIPAYFFQAHDAQHSIFFLVQFDQVFKDGYWWPRWSPDFSFGYGYPLFNLYAPLAFYAAQLLHTLGLGMVTAIKTMYALATIGAGLSMYLLGRRLFGRWAGLLAGVTYIYIPFHLVEIFVRSAYAEFVALALIPLLFLAFTNLIAGPSLPRLAAAGFSYGLLALTHHTTFFTFSPLLMLYIAFLLLAKYRLDVSGLLRASLYPLGSGLLGVALAMIYLLPVIFETRYIKVEQWTSGSYSYLQHFVYPAQLFDPAWGYGYAGPGTLDDFSYQLGIVPVVLLGLTTVAVFRRRFPHHSTALFFLVVTGLVILLMSPLAEPVWQLLPIAALVQFPWRLLGITAFTISLVAGAVVAQPATQTDSPPPGSLYVLALGLTLASFSYTLPQYTAIPDWAETPLAVVNWDRASIVDRVGMVAATEVQPQTSPMEAEYLAEGRPTSVAAIIQGDATVELLHHGGASDIVQVQAEGPVTLQFHTYDYPGWQVYLNDSPIPHRAEPPYALITVDLPPGPQTVRLQMDSTPPRTIGTAISGLAVLVMVGLVAVGRVRITRM